MAERGDSSERYSNLTTPTGAGQPQSSSSEINFQRHKLKWEQDVRELVYEILLEKFMEDLEMSIKLFTLKTRMLRLHQRRQRIQIGGILASSSYDWYDDKYDVELAEMAVKEEYRTRRAHHRYRTFYSCNPGRRDLTPFFNEHKEIGPATLRRVRLLRHVMKDDLDIRLDEIPTQEELTAYAMIQCILSNMHRRSWKKQDKHGANTGQHFSNDDDHDDSFFIPPCIPTFFAKTSTSNSRRKQTFKSNSNTDSNLQSSPAKSSKYHLSEKSTCTEEHLETDDDLEQNLFCYYNSEFIKHLTSGFPPLDSILSGVSDLDVTYNYLRNLNEEVQEYVQWANISVELDKPVLRSDFPIQPQTEADADDLASIKVEFDVDIEAANHEIEIEKHILPSKSETKPKVGDVAVNDDLTDTVVVKKKRTRCMHCNKRLNITNTYTCRCGKIFCSQHRYSECHDCSYDYKAEGRKLTEKRN